VERGKTTENRLTSWAECQSFTLAFHTEHRRMAANYQAFDQSRRMALLEREAFTDCEGIPVVGGSHSAAGHTRSLKHYIGFAGVFCRAQSA
jgi:hypothetical protein